MHQRSEHETRADAPRRVDPVVARAFAWGALAALVLTALIVAGSRRLESFDAALVAYTFGTIFAAFAITYRYAVWLQRPPTALYWRRGWAAFLAPRRLPRNLAVAAGRFVTVLCLNLFLWRRGARRAVAHLCLLWGCVLAALITFPLVFGWLHFETVPGSLERYRLFVFGFPTIAFATDSALAGLLFHGLVISSFLVIAGVLLAMRRRMREHGAAAVQRFGYDILPLVLLFAISVTGLLLWVSYEWMYGYAYDFLAIVHAATVILTLLWLPFGKLFHVFQRPAQLGVAFYRSEGEAGERARCARCAEPFASRQQIEDLIDVERRLGYRYEAPAQGLDHYQRVCPRCRRALLALSQGREAVGAGAWEGH